MNIELLGLVYVFANSFEDDIAKEELCDQWFCRNEYPRRFIARIWGPRFRSCDG